MRDMPGAVDAAGGDLAKAALAAGLVDKLARPPRVRSPAGRAWRRGRQRAAAATSASSSNPTSPIASIRTRAARSASLRSPGRSSTARRPTEPPAATASPRRSSTGCATSGLKALVVRVDSPGGSVIASERIRQAILAAKDKRLPVVVSMGNVAASGGYWVATPGRLHLRRAVDHHRLDRRVRRPAELPGDAGQARHRRRRHQDDAAVGRAGPAQRAPRPRPTA